ncbi:MAG: DUF3021 domain-containing protein [Oscillospiraceae bacterium]|jgi:hypothetical protein|nr:DUF3021 domain-containing protein [Oscillospiraceae bacterium]
MKNVFKKICSGIGMGCFAFVAMLFVASAIAGDANTFFTTRNGAEWLQLAVCFIAISIGFYVPTLVYENEKMAMWFRTLIHMLIGTVVYLTTAYFAGWMKAGLGATVVYISLALVAAGAFWSIFMSISKIQAKKINEKIKEKQQSE